MRDSKRIRVITNEFAEIWEQVPDWRFGQLISNMIGQICHDHDVCDIFFPEDDKWLEWLREYKGDGNGPYAKKS